MKLIKQGLILFCIVSCLTSEEKRESISNGKGPVVKQHILTGASVRGSDGFPASHTEQPEVRCRKAGAYEDLNSFCSIQSESISNGKGAVVEQHILSGASVRGSDGFPASHTEQTEVNETIIITSFNGTTSPLKMKTFTILSIDEGFVRGVVAGPTLSTLEQRLQALDGEDARIAYYVDAIAGTGTGGLIAAMLTLPDKNGHAMLAKDIVLFYLQKCPQIFPRSNRFMRLLGYIRTFFQGPIYPVKNLHQIIRETIPNLRLNETITNLVIPTYDIKDNKAVIFSSYKARKDTLMNPHLKDILFAAPVYFSPCRSTQFKWIDGGLFANDPTFVAMSEAVTEYRAENPEDKNLEYLQFVVLSVGTGEASSEYYNAETVEKWGLVQWCEPLIGALFKGNADAQNILKNFIWNKVTYFLRLQPRNLSGDLASLDNSSEENLLGLANLADRHLQQVVNKDDFQVLDINDVQNNEKITYQKALDRFAEKLSDEKKRRIASTS